MTAAALLCLAAVALLLASAQAVALRLHLRAPPAQPRSFPFISILKPLCGVDDAAMRRMPSRCGQRGAGRGGCAWSCNGARRASTRRSTSSSLSAAARGEVLVVSDSNVRVRRDYLRGIVAAFEDPRVGLVTHAVAGTGERTLGALFDNLNLCGSIAPGVVSARRIAGRDLVVGKSMALRRKDLRAMGGFERLKDVLAEDFLSGRIVTRQLGKTVALAVEPVFNVSRSQSVPQFFRRYLRWSVMQRMAVGNAAYACQILLNPVALAAAALCFAPGRSTALAFCVVALARSALHECSARALRGHGFSALSFVVPVTDLLVACAWAAGLFRDEINWRGNGLVVREGTRLGQPFTPGFADLARMRG